MRNKTVIASQAKSTKVRAEGAVEAIGDTAQLFSVLNSPERRQNFTGLIYKTVLEEEREAGSSDPARAARDAQRRFEVACEYIEKLNKRVHTNEFNHEISKRHEYWLDNLKAQLENPGLVSPDGQVSDLEKVRRIIMQTVQESNEYIRSDEARLVNEVFNELGHYGVMRGGTTGLSRRLGKTAEAVEKAWMKIGEITKVGDTDIKKAMRLETRVEEQGGANPISILSQSFLDTFGRTEIGIILDISDNIGRLVTRLGGISDESVDAIITVLTNMHTAEIIESEASELFAKGMSTPVGYRDSNNIAPSRLKVFLEPEIVSETMYINLKKYVSNSRESWLNAQLEKSKVRPKASEKEAIDDMIDHIGRFIAEFKSMREGPEKILLGKKIKKEYLKVWKLVNSTWASYFIPDDYERQWLHGEIRKAESLLEASATSRRLLNYYLSMVKRDVFKLSKEEIKFLDNFLKRDRIIADYMADDKLWTEIMKKIEAKFDELAKEKRKEKQQPMGVQKEI